MLAKITGKNQLTLPKGLVANLGNPEYFDVRIENGHIVLEPIRIQYADAARAKLTELGIAETDVEDAVTWARTAKR
jgi:hypothetical protein